MKHSLARLTHPPELSNDEIHSQIIKSCLDTGFKVVNSAQHVFQPQGYTAAIILAESHFTVHTFPEHGFMMVDCFSCNGNLNPGEAIIKFCNYTGCKLLEVEDVER